MREGENEEKYCPSCSPFPLKARLYPKWHAP